MRRGVVLAIEKFGNDGADELACIGADIHAAPAGLVSMATQRRVDATRVQKMMLEILAERRRRERLHATEQESEEFAACELADRLDVESGRG